MKSFGLRIGMLVVFIGFAGCGGGGPPVGAPSAPPSGTVEPPPGPSPADANKATKGKAVNPNAPP